MKAQMLFGGLLAMAAMTPEEQQRIAEWEKRREERQRDRRRGKPIVIEPKQPAGTKEYFFSQMGEPYTERDGNEIFKLLRSK